MPNRPYSDGAGPLTLIGTLIAGVIESVRQDMARGDAARKAREAEKASRAQQKKWLDEVHRQKARGHAGNASIETARAALRGRGGRPSKLDERWF